MSTIARADAYIPVHPEVPDKTRHRIVENMFAGNLARAQRLHRVASRHTKLAASYREAAESLVGKDRYARLRDYIQKARQEERAKLRPPAGPSMSPKEREELRKRQATAAAAFVRRLGFSVDKLRRLNERWAKQIVVPRKPGKNKGARMVPEREVPKEILERKTNPWTIREPPYDGWGWNLSVELQGNMWYDDQEDQGWFETDSGMVGDRLGLANYGGATDWDRGTAQRQEALGFWYQMPSAGLVEMWVEMQNAFNQHHWDAYKEWGWADWSFHQQNSIAMWAEGSSESAADTTWMGGWHIIDQHWDNHYWNTGDIGWFHYISDMSYAANEWVWVQAGNRNRVESFANDFQTDNWMHFRWFVKSIHVHSTGDND